MKKLILSLVFFSLLSCSNNDDSNSNLQNETLSYKSWDDFMDSYTKLSENLSENSERVKQKIKKDESLSILSPALNEILNNENEIIINNNIYWFFDGNFYNLGNNRDLKKKYPNIKVSNEIIISKKEFVSNSTDDSNELNNRFNLNHVF